MRVFGLRMWAVKNSQNLVLGFVGAGEQDRGGPVRYPAQRGVLDGDQLCIQSASPRVNNKRCIMSFMLLYHTHEQPVTFLGVLLGYDKKGLDFLSALIAPGGKGKKKKVYRESR